jgi:hypothetical protein
MTCSLLEPDEELGDDTPQVILRILLAGSDCEGKLDSEDQVGEIDEGGYRSVGAPHWCYRGPFLPALRQRSRLQPSHC